MIPLMVPLMLAIAGTAAGPGEVPALNFVHIDRLTERISIGSDTVSILHIYANYPDYRWVAAAESGPEGIACVDDAARCAVMLMRSYELNGDRSCLSRARGFLAFVKHMQAPDGEFYNFIRADHSINTTGRTSLKSFGWWASRGLWAMAMGARVFRESDPAFARELESRVAKMIPLARAALTNEGSTKTVSGFTVPLWLLYESGADVSSELLLGLVEYGKISPDDSLRGLITSLARGLMIMQDGSGNTPPYGLHRSWETLWHMWGNGQTQALSGAGLALHDTAMIASAEREARGWYGRLLMDGFLKEFDVARKGPPAEFEQIAYGIRPMAVGLVRLYEATGNGDYLLMAGLAASWLTGNNPASKAMYDPATGRCYDGIRDSLTLNLNSGAESTVEALYTLIEVERYPAAAACLQARKSATGRSGKFSWALFRGPSGSEIILARRSDTGELAVYQGNASREFRRKEDIP